nr:cytochrome b [uncultured Sphingomonas sp.]
MADRMVDQTSGNEVIPYRPIVIAIHWISAALILTQMWLGYTFHDLPKGTPERDNMFLWHKTVGVTILLLVIVRLIVRLMNPPPLYPSSMPRWDRMAAIWVERLLYFFMFALPLTGLMAVSKGGSMTSLQFGLAFPTIPLPDLGELHEPLVFGMWVLLAIHVLAALKHQFVDRDGVAGRMIPFLRRD